MKTAESIFSKNYTALTAKEKAEYMELFHDEATFNQVKNTLLHIENAMKEDIITPEEATKNSLMEQFEAKWSKKSTLWYKQISIFLFQPGRPLFYKPAFQMACLALLIVAVFQWSPMEQNTLKVASNQITQHEEAEHTPAPLPPPPPVVSDEMEKASTSKVNEPRKGAQAMSIQGYINSSPTQVGVLQQKVDRDITVLAEEKNAESYAEDPITTTSATVADGETGDDEFSHSDWLGTALKKEKTVSKNSVFTNQESSLLDLLETAY